MEKYFLAFADKTRLRILNLMRDEEICAGLFTEVLRESQPKISRHLAYLRKAGLVEAKRDGKWIYYLIAIPVDEDRRRVLEDVLDWLVDLEEMQRDRLEYVKICKLQGNPARVVEERHGFISPEANMFEAVSGRLSSPAHNELEDFLL